MSSRALSVTAVLVLAAGAAGAHANPIAGVAPVVATPAVEVPRFEQGALIDGVLDDAVWAQAALLDGFHQFQPVDGRPAEERTEVRVFYTPGAMYFGVHAYDSQPAGMHATMADRDNLSADDTITIYLDTFNDRRRAFYFTVNPLGIQEDGVRTEGNTNASEIDGGDVDSNPDFIFESRGRLTSEGYEVEVRVPFKSLRYPAGAASQVWGLNIERRVRRTGYVDTWTDVRRGNVSFLAQSGAIVGLHDLHAGPVIELQPFTTLMADGVRQRNGSFDRAPTEFDGGVNLRVGLSPDTSLDATFKPDFSQVESDVGQVTINERFALFVPESRAFFLESIDLFSTPNRLIYTRRVVKPRFGGKLTFKRGGLNLAHLTTVDQSSVPGISDALLTATRVRHDLGRDSFAGLTFTFRDQDGAHNTVVAGDGRLVFDKVYFLRAQVGGSWTRPDAQTRSVGAPLWMAEFDRTGRSWGFNYRVNAVGRDFDAQVGYVPRNDLVEGSAANRVSLYGGRGALVESFTAYHGFTRRWLHSDFKFDQPLEEDNTLVGILQLRRGWQLWTQLNRRGFRLDPQYYAWYETLTADGPQPFVPPDSVDNAWAFLGRVTLPSFRKFGGSLQWQRSTLPIFDEGSRGHETRWDLTLEMRPTSTLRLNGSLAVQHLNRGLDGSRFARTLLPRLRLEYQPTRALSFRVVAEYRDEHVDAWRNPVTGEPLLFAGAPSRVIDRKLLRTDVLVSYEPTPGTVAFAGYGNLSAEGASLRLPSLTRLSDGFFVKLAYRFRR